MHDGTNARCVTWARSVTMVEISGAHPHLGPTILDGTLPTAFVGVARNTPCCPGRSGRRQYGVWHIEFP